MFLGLFTQNFGHTVQSKLGNTVRASVNIRCDAGSRTKRKNVTAASRYHVCYKCLGNIVSAVQVSVYHKRQRLLILFGYLARYKKSAVIYQHIYLNLKPLYILCKIPDRFTVTQVSLFIEHF